MPTSLADPNSTTRKKKALPVLATTSNITKGEPMTITEALTKVKPRTTEPFSSTTHAQKRARSQVYRCYPTIFASSSKVSSSLIQVK